VALPMMMTMVEANSHNIFARCTFRALRRMASIVCYGAAAQRGEQSSTPAPPKRTAKGSNNPSARDAYPLSPTFFLKTSVLDQRFSCCSKSKQLEELQLPPVVYTFRMMSSRQ